MAVLLDMPPPAFTQPVSNPRKRKKRAPAAGASADCFKCADRNFKCDRKRPFCSRCLDSGGECSGYKTQLTWGMGVASRGKLRGLSLPVAGTQEAVADVSRLTVKRRRDGSVQECVLPTPIVPAQSFDLQRIDAYPSQKIMSDPHSIPTSATGHVYDAIWDPTFFSMPHTYYPSQQLEIQRLGSAQTVVQPIFSGTERPIPEYSISYSRASVAFSESLAPPSHTPISSYYASNNASDGRGHSESPYFEQQYGFPIISDLVSPDQPMSPENHVSSTQDNNKRLYDGISLLLEAGQSMQLSNGIATTAVEDSLNEEDPNTSAASDDFASFPTSPPFDLQFIRPVLTNIGRTSRLRYLINYYAEVISPVIVAFDSPSNPFRTQMLRLAESSETLQHAIAALAASNLRQRRGIGLLSTGKTAPARRSSFAHVSLTNDYAHNVLSQEDQIREEIMHKRLAVSQLNQQLGHPVLRKDDSILATLLILCLFHVCDSGIAKFQTHFAGVRKLLAFRGDDVKIGSENSRWMSRLFTWFDTLAATVNDRERQITGQLLDMSALCGDWTLENLAGIDGQLFKSISRLGRLNLLHQGRAVNSEESQLSSRPSSLSPDLYASLDGNEWLEPLGSIETDSSKQFWREWNEVRHELLSWRLDTLLFDSLNTESSNLTMEQRVDLENISQSFRYSALLYLERLAHPDVPSSDELIQNWVRQSLKHIQQVVSDVYLLWPLFVTGTECVDEVGRSVIRGRCADIQKDSGFVNNASCLLLLEKIWRINSPQSSPQSDEDSLTDSCGGSDQVNNSAFKFRDVMMREAGRTEGEGEYIVV